MLFLLNMAIIRLPKTPQVPQGLEPLFHAPPAGVLAAGGELFNMRPRLEKERPDVAEWYCSLLADKFPAVTAALFTEEESGHVGRLAEVPFPTLARLWRLQRHGQPVEAEARRLVWAPAAKLWAKARQEVAAAG